MKPRCIYFGSCGGCQLQDRPYEEQLIEKRKGLVQLLADLVPAEQIPPIIASPKIWNYRRRIQLKASPRGELGFFGASSRRVVPIEKCVIAEDALNAQIPELKRRAAVMLQGQRRPSLLSYELTLQEDNQVKISQGEEERSFLQVNALANLKLIELLKNYFHSIKPQRVLELYAGSGNLTYALVQPEINWTAVESNPVALAEAQRLRPTRALNLQWLAGDVLKVLRKLLLQRQSYDLALMDPPRTGLGDALSSVLALKIPQILYVSCSPISLKNDLNIMKNNGYDVKLMQGIDFFPQTRHLEVLVDLQRRGTACPAPTG